MAKVIAFIKDSYIDKKGLAPVIVEYTHLYERWRLNTEIKVNPTRIECVFDEDFEIWKLKSKARIKDAERRHLQSSNVLLREIIDKIEKTVFNLKSKTLSLRPDDVAAEYNRDPKKLIEKKNFSVQSWYEKFITYKEREIGEGINSYRSTHEHFKAFTKSSPPLQLSEIRKGWLEDFKNHLLNLKATDGETELLNSATIHKHFHNLTIFFNWVVDQDEDDQLQIPSALRKLKVVARYGDPIGLNLEQFAEFCNVDLSARPELDRTRDIFIFAVSIGGPRHGDLKSLSESIRRNGFDMKQNVITYFEAKTGNSHSELMVNQFGMEILKKNNYQFPYVPSNQRMNTNLKAIATILNWDETKRIPRYDTYGKLTKIEEVPLKNIFSSKFMRKTAATIDNYLGVPIKTSMQRTGHKTFAAFSRYVDVNKESMSGANAKWNKIFKDLNLQKVTSQEIISQ